MSILHPKIKKQPQNQEIKEVSDVVACVCDYGTFISVAEKLAETMKKVYYYSPYESEYENSKEALQGTGLDKVVRLDDFMEPGILEEIDLFVFPDIGFSDLQKHLKSIGKTVWGNMGASDLELNRDLFLEKVKSVGLPIIPYKKIVGLDGLSNYLRGAKDKWIKINRYRENMETWHHIDYEHSKRRLDHFNVIFGPIRNELVFIVQDSIKSDVECGYDGWSVDGKFPSHSFQGYEKKNELYLGCVMSDDELPEEIKIVNEKMGPILEEYGYRDWWATEIRVSKGKPYFIDPTPRMPGQTGEHQQETIENFADIIWQGANGVLIEPIFKWRYAAEATLHYNATDKNIPANVQWKTLDIPEDVRQWIKLYHYCKVKDVYHFFPSDSDEVGVMIGVGDSLEEAIRNLKENMDKIKELPVDADMYGFVDLVKSIEEANANGITFGDGEVPDIKSIIEE